MSTQLNRLNAAKFDEPLRAISYSMDALIPGFYFWWGTIRLRIGGSLAEINYPGVLHSPFGIALILPGYRIYTTDRDTHDPRFTYKIGF